MGIFETVFPILAIVLLGYLVVKTKQMSQSETNAVAKFVFTYVIPLLLFIATAHAKFPANMHWEFLFSYYAALTSIFAAGMFLAKYIFGFSNAEQSVFSISACYSNTTVIGIPICLYALGKQSMLPLLIIISIHNLVLFSLGIFAAERTSLSLTSFFRQVRKLLWQLFSSPITASLLLGGLFNIFSIPIYGPLESAMTLMSQAAIPAALFVLGTTLNKYTVHGHIAPAVIIVSLKLIIFPLLVWLLVFQIFSITPLWAATALLASAMPVGISAYIFSQKYHVAEAPVAGAIVISTIAGIFTLSVIISYIQALPL